MMRELHGKNYIGYEPAGAGSSTFTAPNPATGAELPGRFHEATPSEVDTAVHKAAEAFVTYRHRTADERARFLEAIAEQLLALGDALVERAAAETALPAARLTSERGRTTNQLEMFADLVREGSWVDARVDPALPDRQPLPRPDLRRMLIPLGPVGVFGSSNFPLAFSVAGGDTASALAAGCPVVVKAHPGHPGTSELVATAILAAARATGMPDGIFSMVHGGPAVGQALVKHPELKAVGFTGSLAGGRALFDAASRRPEPIPVFAEMGSSNPVFVLPRAAAERGDAIAEGLVASVTLGAGQFCTNPGLTVLERSPEADRFLRRAAEALAKTPACTMVNAGIKRSYDTAVGEVTGIRGVEVVARSSASGPSPGTTAYAALLATDAATWLANPRLGEEIFGPATLAVLCDDKAQLLAVASALHGHLTATIHGTAAEIERYRELVTVLETRVGRLIFNGFPTGVEVTHAMQHGGPYPATTDARATSVGTAAILRFVRPLSYQGFPDAVLPDELRNDNPRGIWRQVDGVVQRGALSTR